MTSKKFSGLIDLGQMAAMVIIGLATVAGVAATGLSFFGVLPWPNVAMSYGETELAWSGMALQIGITALVVMITLFLPSARQVLRLEQSHRRFEIDIDDVTRAYRAAHMADRAETFGMRREFDAVRERYQFLKTEADLGEIDAELLTIAAQMSEQSRELAEVYSDTKVARARESLKQRRADTEMLHNRIQQAHSDTRELRRMMEEVDIEESSVAAQLQRLREEVVELGLVGVDKNTANQRRAPHLKTVKPA